MEANWPAICQALSVFGVDSTASCVGVIGTVAVESASTFAPVEEAFWLSPAGREAFYADTTKHAPYSGGTKFHGRGYIQTTHDYNYRRVSEVLRERYNMDVDLVAHPEMLLQAVPAAIALATYWTDRGLAAVSERQDWAGVRRGVFGGADPEGAARIKRIADYLLPRARV